jgi:hypothetical protein
MSGMSGRSEEIADARRATVERAIREIRASLPIPPWSAQTHTDLGLAIRPEADWQRVRVAVNLRLLRVDENLRAAAGAFDAEVGLQLLDEVEEELRDLRVNALPGLVEAIEAHDEAAGHQVELRQLREGYRRSHRRWARWGVVLGPIARRRRAALDREIEWIDEQLWVSTGFDS